MITIRGLGPVPTLIVTHGLGILPPLAAVLATFASITLLSAVKGSASLLPRS